MATKRVGAKSGAKSGAAKRAGTKGGPRKATRTSASSSRPATKKAAAKKSSATKGAVAKSTKRSGRTAAKGTSAPPRELARYRAKRDFTATAEPSGDRAPKRRGRALRFVIQKHAASRLHFDWRLELDGVMKSWAVPKGPSLVPGTRRLAMEVEDHPIAYNSFEGTIPAGEYGGGTVMLWDRGTYEPTDGGGPAALREGYARGKLDVTLHGERLRGAYTMVRTRGEGERAQWLLIKRTDEHASAKRDLVEDVVTSVESGRTMEEIAAGRREWRSNRKR